MKQIGNLEPSDDDNDGNSQDGSEEEKYYGFYEKPGSKQSTHEKE